MHPSFYNLVTLNTILQLDTVNAPNANLANHQPRFVQPLHSAQALVGPRNSNLPQTLLAMMIRSISSWKFELDFVIQVMPQGMGFVSLTNELV